MPCLSATSFEGIPACLALLRTERIETGFRICFFFSSSSLISARFFDFCINCSNAFFFGLSSHKSASSPYNIVFSVYSFSYVLSIQIWPYESDLCKIFTLEKRRACHAKSMRDEAVKKDIFTIKQNGRKREICEENKEEIGPVCML